MRDEPRPDAAMGLRLLSDAGIRTLMLTGDNRRTAGAIGRQLGIEVEAELLPEDKQRIVGRLQKEGFVVAKVGDGINDAPALNATQSLLFVATSVATNRKCRGPAWTTMS